MSYSQKIKNLLHNMKNSNNYYKNNQKNNNISRNCAIYKTNTPLIIEENNFNNIKLYPYKKYVSKNQTSNGNDSGVMNYIPLYENGNYINNQRLKYNNNFIIETNYDGNKSRLNNKNINTINSSKQNYNFINMIDKNNNYINYNNITDDRNLLFHKINHTNINNPNNCNIYFSYHKTKNLNNSDNEIHNNYLNGINNKNYLSRANSKKKKLSSYILKDPNNEVIIYTNNVPLYNLSSNRRKKYKSNPKLYNENYATDINNSYKNTSSRIIKRQQMKSLSELFNEEKYSNSNKNILSYFTGKEKNKYLKHNLLKIDKGHNIIYDNDNKKTIFKRSYNSSGNIRERDNHSGGKIILALDENYSKRPVVKNYNNYIILLQSFWRGYILRKLIKITKELFLLFVPFVNKIKKLFNKYKKYYFIDFKNKIKQYYIQKNFNNKNFPINNRLKNHNQILFKKNSDINVKSQKYLKRNITTSALLNKNIQKKKYIENYEREENPKINDKNQLKINNIFYQKKRLPINGNENKNILINPGRAKLINSNIKQKNNSNIGGVRRLIKRTSYKKFSNVSPDYRNIQIKINNSSKYLLNDNKNTLNNYSSSISKYNQTRPENRLSSINNLVYINKNQKPKHNFSNSIKNDMFEKIKIKIFNNFYLTLYKCIKKSIYRYHLNNLLNKLKQSINFCFINEEKRKKLKLLIINKFKKIKKHYFRKYRENILIEKIKTKLFYLTDYSSGKSTVFNSKYSNLKNNLNKKEKNLLDIYIKYKIKNSIKKYFSFWKMYSNYNFIKIDFPLSSSRGKYVNQNYSNKMFALNNNDLKSSNKNEIFHKKNYNYIIKNDRSPIKENMIQSQSYADNFFSQNKKNIANNTKYSKKKISNQNTRINNINQNKNSYYYNKNKFSSFNQIKKIFDKINNKNLVFKSFNKWKKKSKIGRK